MKPRIAALCVLSITVMLAGCVQYKWVKPGVSDAEMNKKLTECEAQALIDLPPDNVVTGSSSEKTDKKHKKKDVSTSYMVEDANEYRRDTLVDSCMFKSGWDKIEVQ
ncbi:MULTISPECIES: hypothetical protein [Enterobacter cloacae complex]|uniref:Lipoprotein n=1 Tax=Enterobacter cloacae TaxID=550 RepID=A0A7H8U9R6_ENTCL|nr:MULTISPECIES: hypothetical protein [Enterobacter cloacae complex]MDE4080761.1 hypothetical protein [Enterobacter pasteurii]QKZ96515.1 hypothetical protein HWQ14_01775 [Enterobacter cloacae]